MKGFEKLSVADIERRNLKISEPKPSKYHNVRVEIDGEKFDSKHEAQIWSMLRMREKAGEISDLSRQFSLDLKCPHNMIPDCSLTVAHYIADFRYLDIKRDEWKYIDAKSKATRTQIYRLKKKWLELQDGIIIEEV